MNQVYLIIIKLFILTAFVQCRSIRNVPNVCTDNDNCSNEQLEENSYSYTSAGKQALICEACNAALPSIIPLVKENKTDHIESIVIFFCNEFKIEDPTVCDYVVKQFAVCIFCFFLH